ncbi:50S ribosomal protein L25/general stress protein Ctc [Mumia zhuanghuii]|uniref:Large ribosomal subunit protein bL25 n=2 Tax=Mumia TaxID=1546255 RepID=A0ABW1QI92_9ACTN|nr:MULTISPECIES: 50S ribosomal protein L25/general stress protein Ctc [Mumia]KAA1422792.1 50S ribosomal protein L25/general stress protein Ctc [Mumia zhuanghuii]
MSEIKIKAETRTEFGKGAARRIRRDSKVPAVLYGHGIDPIHVVLPGHELMLALKQPNALLSVDIEGDAQLALPKQVQRDPIKGFIEHADLLVVRRGEKVTVDVPIVVTGEVISGAMVVTEHASVPIEAEATHLPETIEVDVEGLDAGAQIHASDLKLAKGSSLAVDPEQLIVNVVPAPTAEQVEAELETAEAEAGVERDEPQVVSEAAEDDATEAAPSE